MQRYLRDEPVEACPPTIAYRLRKFARKYRGVLSTAAAFVALLLIASTVSIWLALVATDAEATANDKRQEAEKAVKQAVYEGERAQKEWRRAEDAAKRAEANAAATGRALDRMTVAEGIQLAEEGKFFTALPHFIEPLERGGLTAEEEKLRRIRIACYLRSTPGRPRLRHILFGQKADVEVPGRQRLLFSKDAKRALKVSGTVVQVWDLPSGALLATLKHHRWVQDAQFSADGTLVLTSAGDGTVWKWDAANGRPLNPPVVDWEGLLNRPLALLPTSPWQFLTSAALRVGGIRSRFSQRKSAATADAHCSLTPPTACGFWIWRRTS